MARKGLFVYAELDYRIHFEDIMDVAVCFRYMLNLHLCV